MWDRTPRPDQLINSGVYPAIFSGQTAAGYVRSPAAGAQIVIATTHAAASGKTLALPNLSGSFRNDELGDFLVRREPDIPQFFRSANDFLQNPDA